MKEDYIRPVVRFGFAAVICCGLYAGAKGIDKSQEDQVAEMEVLNVLTAAYLDVFTR